MKPIQSIVIGTAGHIDHGKTALIRALTGIDTDRLPEEKRRGITIDLGFASMEVNSPDGTPLRISFVDVPGHALFIRNMLAGAGCVPAVMLVIAADEGVMPQTREHLAICELLGISDGFTVISKSDLVSESRLQQVSREIEHFLRGTFLGKDDHLIVPASAHTGAGLTSLRAELIKLVMRTRAADSARPMRLPIDRTFVKKGFGTVVTGTLLSSEIRVGQILALEPGTRSVRVRGLQTHGESEEVALAGSRVAVNLSGVDAAQISRGQTLVTPSPLGAVDVIDAEIKLLEDAPELKQRARLHFHAFTSEVMASISLYGNEAVKPGDARPMRLKLASPVVLAPGDRFVLRQPLPAGTIGGGRVLDTSPLPRQRKSETATWLKQVAHASTEQQVLLRIRRRGVEGIRMDALAHEMGITPLGLRDQISALATSGEVLIIANDLAVSFEAFQNATDIIFSRVKSAGTNGLKRSEVWSQTGLRPDILNAVLDHLVADKGIQVHADIIALATVSTAIRGKDGHEMRLVATAYLTAGLAAPTVREIAQQLRLDEPEIRRIVTLLLREKSLVRMGSDNAFVHTKAVEHLVAQLAPLRGKRLDVAGFKTLTGLTRKYAIPLLEYLDRERITRKQGDERVIL
jgi:selenocysteine-specific elongation factor